VNDFSTLAKRASLRRWKNKAMEHKSWGAVMKVVTVTTRITREREGHMNF
jgi:hypothetical protein